MGDLDYLLIDLPPGTGDAQLSLAQVLPLDGAVIVTTPQKAAVDVARRGARMFEKVNVPLLGVVENMSYLLIRNLERKVIFLDKGEEALPPINLKLYFLEKCPLIRKYVEGGDHGTPVVVVNPENPSSESITEIARKLTEILPS